jgi:hypothetical protein
VRSAQFRIYQGIEKEILENVRKLAAISSPETRGDYLRLIRAAVELLPARPPDFEQWEKGGP